MVRVLTFLLVLFLSQPLFAGIEYFAYWQQVTIEQIKKGKYELDFIAQFRFLRPIVNCRRYEFGERLTYAWLTNLEIATAIVYITERRLDDDDFRSEWRMEFELNPLWKQLLTRNRLEIRRRQGEGNLNYRSRHRAMIYFPIENCRHLKRINVHDEIFYDYGDQKWTENRLVPIDLQFKFSQSTLNVYVMLRSHQAVGGWNQNWVLGSDLRF